MRAPAHQISTSLIAAARTIARTSSSSFREPTRIASSARASLDRDPSSRGSTGSASVSVGGSHGDARDDEHSRDRAGRRVLLRMRRRCPARGDRARRMECLAQSPRREKDREARRESPRGDQAGRAPQRVPTLRASARNSRRGAGRVPRDPRRSQDISARGVRVRGLLSSQPIHVARALSPHGAAVIFHCWNAGPHDPRDGMFTFCQLERGHAGRCKFERDHLGSGSTPWHPCQTETAEARADGPRVCPLTNRLEERT